jgi:hypothetical protein
MYSTCGSRILETRAQRRSCQQHQYASGALSCKRLRPGREQAGFIIMILCRLQQRVFEVRDVLESRVPAESLRGGGQDQLAAFETCFAASGSVLATLVKRQRYIRVHIVCGNAPVSIGDPLRPSCLRPSPGVRVAAVVGVVSAEQRGDDPAEVFEHVVVAVPARRPPRFKGPHPAWLLLDG